MTDDTKTKETILRMLAIFWNMIKEALLKALVPVTIITFAGICALAPLYVTMGLMTRQMESSR